MAATCGSVRRVARSACVKDRVSGSRARTHPAPAARAALELRAGVESGRGHLAERQSALADPAGFRRSSARHPRVWKSESGQPGDPRLTLESKPRRVLLPSHTRDVINARDAEVRKEAIHFNWGTFHEKCRLVFSR